VAEEAQRCGEAAAAEEIAACLGSVNTPLSRGFGDTVVSRKRKPTTEGKVAVVVRKIAWRVGWLLPGGWRTRHTLGVGSSHGLTMGVIRACAGRNVRPTGQKSRKLHTRGCHNRRNILASSRAVAHPQSRGLEDSRTPGAAGTFAPTRPTSMIVRVIYDRDIRRWRFPQVSPRFRPGGRHLPL
jgi:hypothetical protein